MRIVEITKPDILSTIKRDCKPFLQLIDGKVFDYLLWRGIMQNKPTHDLTRKIVHLDKRNPLSTNNTTHTRYNEFFKKEFGAPFRNALFVSGAKGIAEVYGWPFIAFPIGNFDWIWSPNIDDLAMAINWPDVSGFLNVPPSQEVVDEKLSEAGYIKNAKFKEAIESRNEIMIRCKEYYVVRPEALDVNVKSWNRPGEN